MIYWDTSCVLKLYANESDSARWRDLVKESGDELVSSVLLDLELAYALEQKEGRGELKAGAARHLHGLFREDCRKGFFKLFPMGTDVLQEAVELARIFCRAKGSLPLRTLDGIHLGTARLLKCRKIATADDRMKTAAIRLEMRVL